MSSAYVHVDENDLSGGPTQTVQQLKEQVRVNSGTCCDRTVNRSWCGLYLYCANRSEPKSLNLWKFFVDVATKMRLRLRLLTCRPTATCKQGVTTVHIEA